MVYGGFKVVETKVGKPSGGICHGFAAFYGADAGAKIGLRPA